MIGSAGIALGLLILGKKVMMTVGSNIVILDFYKGFHYDAHPMSIMISVVAGLSSFLHNK
jgi:phosphate/sulfate permease